MSYMSTTPVAVPSEGEFTTYTLAANVLSGVSSFSALDNRGLAGFTGSRALFCNIDGDQMLNVESDGTLTDVGGFGGGSVGGKHGMYAMSFKGRYQVVVFSDTEMRILKDGAVLQTITVSQTGRLDAQGDFQWAVAISGDGKRIWVVGRDNGGGALANYRALVFTGS